MRTTTTVPLLAVILLAACGQPAPSHGGPTSQSPLPLDAGAIFDRARVEGTFVLHEESTGRTFTTNARLADTGFRPQSTFKIPHALIGLETGVISGECHTWRWDGAPRTLKAWEQDLDLGGALTTSCVPCFQEVARGVGADRMRQYLRVFRYGNEDISGPIDRFWLDGPLRISPREQTEFLHRMLGGELPVPMKSVDLIWDLLEIESGPGFTWRGKTGLGTLDGRAIGWLVGYAERNDQRWIYATFVRSRADADPQAEGVRLLPLRRAITREILRKAAVLPEAGDR